MKTICLNMIIKNESQTIQRCLSSVKPFIDYWIIADTGSSDNTRELVQYCLQTIPGKLIERPWVDFSYNRNEVLIASKGICDYILFIDADEELQFSEPLDKSALDKDSYSIRAIGSTSEFHKMFLVSSRIPWQWRGVIHESISTFEPTSLEFLENLSLLYDEKAGYRARNPEKYLDDSKVLEKALAKEPNHPRYTFYLAQCYSHAGLFEAALTLYEKRVELGGDAEEIFWSYYCIGCLKKDLQYPSSKIIEAFCKAYQYKPTQAEPLYRLAEHFDEEPFLAYLIANYAKDIPPPKQAARLQGWIYKEIPQQYAKHALFMAESDYF